MKLLDALQGPSTFVEETTVLIKSGLLNITEHDCQEYIVSAQSSGLINFPTILALISTATLVYLQWKNLPDWMKFGSPKKKRKGIHAIGDMLDQDANDHLASMPVVLEKLQQMMKIMAEVDSAGREGIAVDDIDQLAAFYSLLHLYKEIETKDPDYRDKLYNKSKDVDVELSEVKELAEYLEYAHWAYEESHETINSNCKKSGLDLITHDTATEPGRVGHYVACNHDAKLAIIGLKGTSTLSDVLTDLIAIPKEHVGCHFDNDTFSAPKGRGLQPVSMYCHEGIFTAAMWVADHLQPMIENLLVPLNYKVVICGHSLGAGTACLLGLELRSRIKSFQKNYTDLRVLAFATPPVVSYKASKACAPFVTSVVNNADVVPRCSIANLTVMDKLLLMVHVELVSKGVQLGYSFSAIKRYYKEHSIIDNDLLLTEAQLDAFFQETLAAPEDETKSLFVPGRVVVMWDKGENDNHKIGGIVTDCGMKMLRQVECRSSLITDHFVTDGYRPNLQRLLEQLQNSV